MGIQRRAVLVLGMHRSGTSILTRIVAALGAQLPATPLPSNAYNESGYWESLRVNRALEGLLKAAGSSWSDWRAFDPGWHHTAAARPHIGALREAILEEFGDAPLFVLKDPRFSRLMPLAKSLLAEIDVEPSVLIALRHPLEIAGSLAHRDAMPLQQAGLLWLRHMLDSERETRTLQRAFVHFGDLTKDWAGTVRPATDRIGLPWPADDALLREDVASVLDPRRHHNKADAGDFAWTRTDWHRRAFDALSDYCGDPDGQRHSAELDAIADEFTQASNPFAEYAFAYDERLRKLAEELERLRRA